MVKVNDLLSWYRKYLGVRETWGVNWGPEVKYFQSSTGAYRAAWCVSYLQKGLQECGVGRIADRTAGVFYLAGWARKHGLVSMTPKRGYFACYMWNAGHIGIVETVHHDGSFTAIEGNASNSVRRKWRDGRNTLFVQIPGVDYRTGPPAPKPKPKPKWVPRFQIVSGEGKKAKVLVGWGKWSSVSARIPRLVAAGRAYQIRRKLVKT